mgnify:CR=1 FL=1
MALKDSASPPPSGVSLIPADAGVTPFIVSNKASVLAASLICKAIKLSLCSALLEETYETIECIENNEMNELSKELGDILLHVVFQSVIAEEQNEFTLDDVIQKICEKLIHRHPHVFSNAEKPKNKNEQKFLWEKMKLAEGRTSVIDGVPKTLPALQQAQRVQEKASKVGFDWNDKNDVWKKVEEELTEFSDVVETHNHQKIEDEFGDILFALVNYARFININPEIALRRTTQKFSERFRFIENSLQEQGKDIYKTSLDEMNVLWEKAKKKK